MIKKLREPHGSLRKCKAITVFPTITADRYKIYFTRAWDVLWYNSTFDSWSLVATFGLEENADKFINLTILSGKNPCFYSLKESAYSLFEETLC